VLKKFRHPNIVILYGFNITIQQNSQFLVYEYLINGSLNTFLTDDRGRTRLPSHVRIAIMFQLARAIHFLHTGGCDNLIIFHRDIKSGNICLTHDYTAKLIDCGLAKFAPDGANIVHSASVTPTMLKSSGAAVFGTPGYICPVYARGNAQYSAACDAYSIGVVLAELITGCLQGGQSTRNGTRYGDFFCRYIRDDDEEPILDGWKTLLEDADPAVEWNEASLKHICDITVKCMAASPKRRPPTKELVKHLGKVSTIEYGDNDGIIGDALVGQNELLTALKIHQQEQPQEMLPPPDQEMLACVLCHESMSQAVQCSNQHPTCVSCVEQLVQTCIGKSAEGAHCNIVGCSSQFTDEMLYGKISPSIFTAYTNERVLQKLIDKNLELINHKFEEMKDIHQKSHDEVMISFRAVKSGIQRSLAALAYVATESVKKCPTLVWLVPAEETMGRSAKYWIKWPKTLIHRKYNMYFICQHSFTVVEPKMEIEVTRPWLVQAAPVLHLSMFLIKTALCVSGVSLPFPIPNILRNDQIVVYEEFVTSFVDESTTKVMNAFKSACFDGTDLHRAESSQLVALTGPAYEGIVDKATKMKRSHWKQSVQPVVNHLGTLIWVKNEYRDLY
jgi:serine/threonine protein kinase